MLERFFTDPKDVDRLRRGALGDALDDVATFLHEGGYSRTVARAYLLIAGHFSHWLSLERIAPAGLRIDTAARFRDEHWPVCRCPRPRGERGHVNASLGRVLDVLKVRRWCVPSAVSPSCPVNQILHAFDTHLNHTCGAAPATRRLYTRYARGFLDSRFGAGEVDLHALKPEQMIDFISEQARERSPETARVIRTALRSLFRFAQLKGLCDGTLASAVPRVARWKRAPLPRTLSDQQLATLLKAFDRSTAIGRRDYVITLCLAQLGLRAGEVAALTLDDVDWRSAALELARTKERRASTLPLPAPLGRAIASYLRRDRPPTQKRQLFVRHCAPFGKPLTSDAVQAIVHRAFARADLGVTFRGAHVLRHTAATRMVRAGSSFKEVADVLRHRSLETVMIYAKLDLPTLAAVAQPWPEVQS